VPAQARQVAAVLDAHGLRGVTVVGHSSGGYVATSLAEQRRELVGALVLVSSGPRPDALLPQPALLRVLTSRPLGGLVWALRTDRMVRRGIGVTAARPIVIPGDMVADLKGTTYHSFISVLRENEAYIAERSIPERLVDLDVPVLVVFGAADPRWDPSSARDYEIVPGARIEMLPGVGHVAMLEAPEALSRALVDFAARGR
jgi:pimeloyl-ACP methyl ester carboxylesterase